MTAEETTRPKPGHLSATSDWQIASIEWEYARDGEAGQALLANAIGRQQKAANELHYLLRHLATEFDRAAIQLEQGKRQHVLPGSTQYYEIPQRNVLLNEATQAVQEAQHHLVTAAGDHPHARAYRLEQAAITLDATVEEAGLKGAHPLATQLRTEAASIREAHVAEQVAKRDSAADKEAQRVARIKASPLGKVEQKHLQTAAAGGLRITRYTGQADQKAATKLVTRGYLAKVPTEGSAMTEYHLTDEGTKALLAL